MTTLYDRRITLFSKYQLIFEKKIPSNVFWTGCEQFLCIFYKLFNNVLFEFEKKKNK